MFFVVETHVVFFGDAEWRFTMLGDLILNESKMKDVILRSIKLCMDTSVAKWLTALVNDPTCAFKVPSASVLSKKRIFFDCALMLLWREILARRQRYHYIMADSSPQFGRDLLLVEDVSSDVGEIVEASELVDTLALLAYYFTVEDSDPDAVDTAVRDFRELTSELGGLLDRHVWVPMGLGCRRAGLAFKLHALFHAMFLEVGSWKGVKELCRHRVVSITTDMGVEMGIASTPLRWDDFLPKLATPNDVSQSPLDVLLEDAPELREFAEVSLLQLDEDMQLGDALADMDDGLFGGAPSPMETPSAKRPRVGARLVPSEAGGFAEGCMHRGCNREVWCCCPERLGPAGQQCLQQLCAEHFVGAQPSRCHEHARRRLARFCPCVDCRVGVAGGSPQQGANVREDLPTGARQQDGQAQDRPPIRPTEDLASPLKDSPPFFGRALRIPGALHSLHSVRKGLTDATVGWGAFKPLLEAVVVVLHDDLCRERFREVCLGRPRAKEFRPMFASFPHTLADWRWGEVLRSVRALTNRETPLRMYFDARAMLGKKGDTDDDAAIQDEVSKREEVQQGSNRISKASEALCSPWFWAFAHLLRALDQALDAVEAWFKSCPCHIAWMSRGEVAKRLGQPASSWSCPMIGRRLPELAAGAWRGHAAATFSTHSHDLLPHCAGLSMDERTTLLADWDRARARTIAIMYVKLRYAERLPYKLAAVALADEDTARYHATMCHDAWRQQQGTPGATHVLTRMFFDETTDPVLASEVRQFLNGAPRANLKRLSQEAAALKFVPLNETSIEAKHALMKTNLRSASRVSETTVSLAARLPEWRRRFEAQPDLTTSMVTHLDALNHGDFGAVIRDMGLLPHPVLHESLTKHKRLPLKIVRSVLYHSDGPTVYASQAAAEKALRKHKAQQNSKQGGPHRGEKGALVQQFIHAAAIQHFQKMAVPGAFYTATLTPTVHLCGIDEAQTVGEAGQALDQPCLRPIASPPVDGPCAWVQEASTAGLPGVSDDLSVGHKYCFLLVHPKVARIKQVALPAQEQMSGDASLVSIYKIERLRRREKDMAIHAGPCQSMSTDGHVETQWLWSLPLASIDEYRGMVALWTSPSRVSMSVPEQVALPENLVDIAENLLSRMVELGASEQKDAFEPPEQVLSLPVGDQTADETECLLALQSAGIVDQASHGHAHPDPNTTSWYLTTAGQDAVRMSYWLKIESLVMKHRDDVEKTEWTTFELMEFLDSEGWDFFEDHSATRRRYSGSVYNPANDAEKRLCYVGAKTPRAYLVALAKATDGSLKAPVPHFKAAKVYTQLLNLRRRPQVRKAPGFDVDMEPTGIELGDADPEDQAEDPDDGGSGEDLEGACLSDVLPPSEESASAEENTAEVSADTADNRMPNDTSAAEPADAQASASAESRESGADGTASSSSSDSSTSSSSSDSGESGNGSASGHAEAAASSQGPRAEGPAAGSGPRRRGARHIDEKSFWWGSAFYFTYKGVMSGKHSWQARCEYHDAHAVTRCTKSLRGVDSDMVVRTLKFWCLSAPTHTTRQAHLGPRGLQVDVVPDDQELEDLLAGLPPPTT